MGTSGRLDSLTLYRIGSNQVSTYIIHLLRLFRETFSLCDSCLTTKGLLYWLRPSRVLSRAQLHACLASSVAKKKIRLAQHDALCSRVVLLDIVDNVNCGLFCRC